MFENGVISMGQINVLGTNYDLIVDSEKIIMPDTDGMCNFYEKVIVVKGVPDMLESGDSVQIKECRHKEVLRHEIIHAFFAESGLADYAYDEVLVDWLSRQIPKINKTFNIVGCF